jgi:hypothetical protein
MQYCQTKNAIFHCLFHGKTDACMATASTYLAKFRVVDRYGRIRYPHRHTWRGVWPRTRTDEQLREFLIRRLKIRPGEQVMVIRSHSDGERRGWHKVLEAIVAEDGLIYLDRCTDVKAIPHAPQSEQPHYQQRRTLFSARLHRHRGSFHPPDRIVIKF